MSKGHVHCVGALKGVCQNCTRDEVGCRKGLSGMIRELYGEAARDRAAHEQEIIRLRVANDAKQKAAAAKVQRMFEEYTRQSKARAGM